MVKHLDAHPLFVKIPDEELVSLRDIQEAIVFLFTGSFLMTVFYVLPLRLMIQPLSMSGMLLRRVKRWRETRVTNISHVTDVSRMRNNM